MKKKAHGKLRQRGLLRGATIGLGVALGIALSLAAVVTQGVKNCVDTLDGLRDNSKE